MRLYSNIAADTVLTADPGVSGTTISGVDFTGWPSPAAGDSALACIDFGGASVELCEYTSRTSTALTGVRGVDGTTAGPHNVGATVRHMASGADVQAFMRYGEAGSATLLAATRYGPNGVSSLATQSVASGTLRECQFIVPARTRFLEIGMEVTTGGAGVLRFSIWRDNGSGKASDLVLDCGTVSAATTGYKSIAIDLWLGRGLYHLAVKPENATITYRACSVHNPPVRLPAPATTGTTVSTGYQATGVPIGAEPSVFPVGMALTNNLPFIQMLTA